MVLYMRGHEGRGIGLMHKLQAYQLQDAGADTVDANLELRAARRRPRLRHRRPDLVDLGIGRCGCSPTKRPNASAWTGTAYTSSRRVPLPVRANAENIRYLMTKHATGWAATCRARDF